MTTMKRILAVMLAVMLIASISIIGASAAGEKLTLKSETKGFTYTIYQIATLNTTKTDKEYGKYTMVGTVNDDVKNAINEPGKDLLDVLDEATKGDKVVGTFIDTLSEGTMDIEVPGIYYAKVTGTPKDEVVTKQRNSVIVWPEYDKGKKEFVYDTTPINLGSKVASGETGVTKYFSENKTLESKSRGQGDEVEFTLEANVIGSAAMPIAKFQIWDKMSKGMTIKGTPQVYYDEETVPTSDFTVDVQAFSLTDKDLYEGGTYITVTATKKALDPEVENGGTFYNHTTVYVKYTATVNNNAKVGNPGNPNKNGLIYNPTGKNEDEKDIDGREVVVYTYEIQAVKQDGNTQARLKDAVLGLYKDSACTNEIATGTSDADGKVVFKNGTDANALRVAPGRYYVKEITAPDGYALSTAVYEVVVEEGEYVISINVDNYPTKMPQTGGMGTMMFTIIGGMLVLLAGVMFVIVMKKRASVK